MPTDLRHTIVLLIADEHDSGDETEAALTAWGCIAHRVTPSTSIDPGQRYDAALLFVQQNTSQSSMWLRALRSEEVACASLVLLADGGPDAVAESLGHGAVDCLIRPVSERELTESLRCVIEATRRWRARFSRARAQPRRVASPPALTRVFEPSEPDQPVAPASAEPRDAKIEEFVARVGKQHGLTRRERQVLYWLLHGHRYIDIASVLGVAPRTAKFHAANLLGKLELDSRYDLSRLVAEQLERSD